MVTPEGIQAADALIESASKIDDLNVALRCLQNAMGQDDGGIAGHFYSNRTDPEDQWRLAPPEARITELQLYLDLEAVHMPQLDSTPGP